MRAEPLESLPEVAALVVLAGVAYVVGVAWAMAHMSYDIVGGLIIVPVLAGLTVPLITRRARREGDHRLVRILVLAVVVKLVVGPVIRYGVIQEVYGGVADAQGYHGAGRLIAGALRDGRLPADLGGGGDGTQAINLITGLVYTVTGVTELGGFVVFSWLALLGLFGFFAAFRLAFPDGDHHRYAKLVFFLPTMVFWPSSLGKEAWLVLCLGLATYGVASLLTRHPGGFTCLALGLGGGTLVRPHMAMLVFVALVPAYLVRRSPPGRRRRSLAKAAGIATLAMLGIFLSGQFVEYFKLDDLSQSSIDELLERTGEQTGTGGSVYEPVNAAANPVLVPFAVFTVVARPLPTETHNAQALVASLEGLFLLGLLAWSWRRVLAAGRRFLRSPFLAFALTYGLLFCVAFSSIGNFGILARQRVQLYPLLVVVLALPAAWHRSAERAAPPSVGRTPPRWVPVHRLMPQAARTAFTGECPDATLGRARPRGRDHPWRSGREG
ncbi:hypothetical protein BH20ACT2_BH20ACT2_10090 [soil metagenome]